MKRRGLSLIELAVAALLGALVLGICIQFFLSALKVGTRSVTRSRLQQTGMTALLGLIGDLQQANAGGLTFRPDEEKRLIHCVIHPVEDVNGEGLPQYSSQVLHHYYLDRSRERLTRRTYDGGRPSPIALRSGEPMRFSPDEISTLLAGTAREKVYLQVTRLTITTPGVEPEFVGNPLRVELVLAEANEEIRCTRSLVLRNSL